jgi:hypothetical protein
VGWAAGDDCVLGCAGRRCGYCVLVWALMGTSGTVIYYPNKRELSLGIEFQYPHNPYDYQSLGYMSLSSSSSFSGFVLRAQVLCSD